MNNQLINVFNGNISDESVLLCNARDLHEFLGAGKHFASWITERIAEYEFEENQDYILLPNSGKQRTGRGGHNRKEYHLTLDTAKELAMVERNDKGRLVRRYFIECEKKLRGGKTYQTPSLTAAPTYPCRILHTFNEHGVIVGARIAEPDEDLTSPKNFAETLKKRGYALVRIEEFAGIIA